SRDMIALAHHILDSKAAHFDPSQFEDAYENALKALVRRKAKGHTIEVPEKQPAQDNVIDLMQALRQSLADAKGRTQRPAATRKTAPDDGDVPGPRRAAGRRRRPDAALCQLGARGTIGARTHAHDTAEAAIG